jgi:uncharacterized protein
MTPSEEQIVGSATAYAKERMTRLHSSHGWDHTERVVAMAEHIASTESQADTFIVIAAAVLHDIARIDEVESAGSRCHAELGSEMAYAFLTANGLDPARAGRIRDCILSHRYRNDHHPDSIEAKILYDADKLDSIGAVGVGRAFLFSGEVGARLHNPDIDVNLTRAYSKEDTAYREFMVKMRFIHDRMLSAEGKRIAADRHRFMTDFFARLQDEAKGVR